jgi:hypothetical protein
MKLMIQIVSFFVFSGCVHSEIKNNQVSKFFETNNLIVNDGDLNNGKILELDEDHLIYEAGPEALVKIFKTNFTSDKEATKHLMNRQLAISAMFRDMFEPYYGLVQKKKCVDLSRFSTDLISDKNGAKYFSAEIPVDPYLNPFDCDRGQPERHAQYTFLLCSKNLSVFEVRQYKPTSSSFKSIHILSCGN